MAEYQLRQTVGASASKWVRPRWARACPNWAHQPGVSFTAWAYDVAMCTVRSGTMAHARRADDRQTSKSSTAGMLVPRIEPGRAEDSFATCGGRWGSRSLCAKRHGLMERRAAPPRARWRCSAAPSWPQLPRTWSSCGPNRLEAPKERIPPTPRRCGGDMCIRRAKTWGASERGVAARSAGATVRANGPTSDARRMAPPPAAAAPKEGAIASRTRNGSRPGAHSCSTRNLEPQRRRARCRAATPARPSRGAARPTAVDLA